MLTALARTCLSCSAATCTVMEWSGGEWCKYSISPPDTPDRLRHSRTGRGHRIQSGQWSAKCPAEYWGGQGSVLVTGVVCCVNTTSLSLRYVVITTTNRDLPVKAHISIVLPLSPQMEPDNNTNTTIQRPFMALSPDLLCKTGGCTTRQ